jgi:hypothetical protein
MYNTDAIVILRHGVFFFILFPNPFSFPLLLQPHISRCALLTPSVFFSLFTKRCALSWPYRRLCFSSTDSTVTALYSTELGRFTSRRNNNSHRHVTVPNVPTLLSAPRPTSSFINCSYQNTPDHIHARRRDVTRETQRLDNQRETDKNTGIESNKHHRKRTRAGGHPSRLLSSHLC